MLEQPEQPEQPKRVTDLSADRLRSLISRVKQKGGAGDEPIRPRRDRGGPQPLSFAQERLWFLDQLGEGSAAYAIPSHARLSGPLDAAALSRAFTELVRRHESLRTTFGQRSGVPFQEIAPAGQNAEEAPMPRVDLTALPGPAREGEMLRIAREEARRPFDLARGPLLRNLLVRLGPEDHVLATTMHHIVSDGWSATVLIREIAALYEAFAAGLPSPLPEPALQYADFALWQRERLQGPRLASELAWWSERLAGLEPLELPTDRQRPLVQSHRGARRRLSLSAATTAGLRELGQREGASLFMILLALWDVLLCRWSGHADLAVGTPVANRNRGEVQGLIGFFVNTLVLRADLGGRPRFRELLGRVRENALEAWSHDELPFGKLVEHLQPERLRDRNPLFQVMCTLQNQPWPEMRIGEVRLAPLDLDTGLARFDLTLVWSEGEKGLEGSLEHSVDLYDGATAQRLLRHLLALVRAVLEDVERPIAELPLLGDSELRQVLVEWNRTAADYPRGSTIHELFAARARTTPEAPAVEAGGEVLTYGELACRAARLASRLQRAGVSAETRVGLCLDRSPDLITAMLAVLAAGGAYVPLDPSYPSERLELMLEDAGISVVLTWERLLPDLPDRGLPILCLDRESEAGGEAPLDFADMAGAGPDSLAYVMYTSGSTGRPKGVAVPHRAVVRLVVGTDYVRIGAGDRLGHLSNTAFDASTFEVWGALLAGGTVVVIERDVALSPRGLAAELREQRVTTTFLTTSLFHQVVREEPGAFAALRDLLFGGEACDPALVRRALAAGPERLLNAYGPTEGTTFTTWHRVESVPGGAVTVPIGRPIANTRVYLLDPEAQPAPAGFPAELCIAGDGLARGYLGRPDLTAERFVPDPCSGERGERLYRTGDLARFLPDGAIELLGRIDDQVKIRGFRIEPGEIEAALREHPGVSACAVLSRRDPSGSLGLVAWVAPAGILAAELRSFLAARLPAHMVPAAFAGIDALPLNANGKVDRRALARREPPAEEAREHIPPRTPVELQLAAIWGDLLRRERVGAGDDFFELGGHSLLAVQLISRLRDQLGVEIPVRDLFEEPTLAGLAERIERALRAEGAGAAPPILRVSREGLLPLSFAQERLWFLEQLEPGSAFYNIPAVSRLAGPLRIGVLRLCLDALVRRHESLRTVFGDVQGRPHQEIRPQGLFDSGGDLPLIDLAGLPATARDAELRRRVAEEARRPFDLTLGPLFRIPLFRLGLQEHVLVPTMHHIISDGWSLTVLLREIAALYAAFSAGRAPELPELPVQYADYAVWQRGFLQGDELEARLAWWRERLAGVPGLQLPTDRPRPPVETFRGRQRPVSLSPELTRRLHELGAREGVTLFMTLLAVFQALLLRVTGQTDLPVGSPIANRYRSEIEGVIGFFANTVVLRTDLSGNPSFRELLQRVREVTVGAYAHEDLPFEKLVEELQPERDMSRNPLFQVMCVLQNQPWPEARMGDVELSSLPVDSATAKFDLTLFWREERGTLVGTLEHNTDLFDDSTAWRLYRHCAALLAAVLDDPEGRVGALPLLDAAERHQILREWNWPGDGPGEWAGRPVHDWVEEQVARTPHAPAVLDGGRSLTYAELDDAANRLARGLARRGVRPEALVGICVERSLEMVVAALAVLKAGGALVALDPAYPRERLATIIDDAHLAVLLTQESLLQHFPQHVGIALCLEQGCDPFPEESAESPGVRVDPDHPIYAIYTSGSTGQPKGIVVTHRAFSNLLAWQLADPGLRPGARTVQFATFGFCVSFQEMFSSWCSGGALILADEMTRRDIPGLAAFLEAQEIDRLHLPFAALKHLAEAVTDQRLPARLRAVITAGEQLQVTPAVRSLFDRLPGCTLSNQYGASETHVVSALTLSGDPVRWPAIPPVGRPVANVRIHLLDGGLEPVPAGVAGELYAGGACAPRCYLNDPALTASKLVPDPYSSVPGARLYRTGDAARYLADGRIEYHGRIDTQVKIRGFRVELGEVETVLARHPGVRDAAVVARPGRDGQRLVAYVVPADGPAEIAADAAADTVSLFGELRTHLKQRLPDHMIPSAFVEMPHLPLNANGKLDSAALPEPEPLNARQEEYVAPRTPIEELVAGIWGEVLGLERVGVRSDFFELGGHSLLATQVVARMRQALGVDLGLRALFEARTVEGLTLTVAERLLDLADADIAALAFAQVAGEVMPGEAARG